MPTSSGPITGASPVRVLLFLPFLVVLSVLVTGCGGSSVETPNSESFPTGESPLELLKRSIQPMETVKSFRAHMDVITEDLREAVPLSIEMEVGSDDRVHNTIIVNGPDGELKIEQVIAEPYVYTKVPGQA